MSEDSFLSYIDAEISLLKQARALLAENGIGTRTQSSSKPKRTMSAAARKRIAEAQRKRWAALRKKAAK